MILQYMFRAAVLLPLLGPVVAAGALLATGYRRGRVLPGLLPALLLLLPTFLLAQCLLSVASWCLLPLAEAGAAPLYAPWYAELLLAPVCYLYLRVLTRLPLRTRLGWRRLLPGLGQVGLFAGVAVLNLGYRHGVAARHLGPASAAAELLRFVLPALALACYVLLLLYGLKTLDEYRRHQDARGLARRRRPGRQRTLLVVLLLGFGLGLSFVALDAWFGPFAYSEIWYAFGVRCGLVFGLAVVGLQASHTVRPPASFAWAVALPVRPTHPGAAPLAIHATEAKATLADPPKAPVLPAELLPWRDKLLALMAAEQPWLEPELTLAELAQRLHLHPAQLSKVINLGCGQSFSDFVNRYRVEEAQRKLADPRFAHYSLVGVALESGFNSKSTFNRVFKKFTGQVPGELARPKV
ncbi:helix-turn-helix transcriptional regulator [Hymenobacter sp. BRD128]|uniref:helix-turn-helix domain-containing protein n=1 Tax=Hymenobacter sp. BRD128 TaxID=2675878 RepID=UPI001567699B|nr:helix-turn-helix transcriptional regulator [Hymenobacter sp. BRD128]QKG57167.1 helix-turn-helix transcriptional regulator [Hymenobacter sp. BRD128]